jgi:flagellar basal body-associated protein FliL
MSVVIETLKAAPKVSTPVWMLWAIPLASAASGALLAGAVAWAAFQSNSGYDTHATIAGNQAQIVSLQEQQRSIDAQLANLGVQYVSQNAFLEFKSRYDKDQAEEHDFRVRIDSKMDILLSEHATHLKTQ